MCSQPNVDLGSRAPTADWQSLWRKIRRCRVRIPAQTLIFLIDRNKQTVREKQIDKQRVKYIDRQRHQEVLQIDHVSLYVSLSDSLYIYVYLYMSLSLSLQVYSNKNQWTSSLKLFIYAKIYNFFTRWRYMICLFMFKYL